MEVAIAKAGRTKYGYELDIRAQIDKESGYIGLYRYREVVENIDDLSSEESINKIIPGDLPKDQSKLKIGEFWVEELPPLDFEELLFKQQSMLSFKK